MVLRELGWLPEERAVVWKGRRVTFLPKEFELLMFMARHPGRTFSRDQLLERVWPHEHPVDRTVDDHVFRLRKRLRKENVPIRIETVRGVGYRLAPAEPVPLAVPFAAQVEETLLQLWEQYFAYGRGDSLEALARNGDVLGLRMPAPHLCSYKASLGQLRWFMEEEEIPPGLRFFFLCYFYQLIHDQPERTIQFLEEALRRNLLDPPCADEIRMFALIELLLDAGRVDEADRHVREAIKVIGKDPGHCLRISLRFSESHLRILRGDLFRAGASLDKAEEILSREPYRRETAMLQLFRGVLFAARGEEEAGADLVMRGLEIMDGTRMFLNRLYYLYRWGRLSDRLGVLESLADFRCRRREKLLDEMDGRELMDKMETSIRHLLSDFSLTIRR